MAYRLIVYREDESKPHTHSFDDYESMEYSATMLQFSSNPHLVKIVAQEESPIEWKTLFTIATTNHIEDLEDRYTNRPSRFDRVVEFPLPNAASRKMFIEKTILPEDLKTIDIDKWVEKTDGYSIDHINELILLHFVFGHTEAESFESLDKMNNSKGRLHNTTSTTKKSIGFGN